MNKDLILCGDVIEMLATLPDNSVDCCVTSPPYWGLRDYGTAKWEGGDPNCDHKAAKEKSRYDYSLENSPIQNPNNNREGTDAPKWKDVCPTCGAKKVDRQIGLEKTPEEYVAKMVDVFRGVKRVLKPEGTVWLNIGDTYNVQQQGRSDDFIKRTGGNMGLNSKNARTHEYTPAVSGLRPKNLIGVPWRLAFALQADGWCLRQDIIWSKPNPMPESVTDRCTKAHEYIFLLSKSPQYYYDSEAIKEPGVLNDGREFGVVRDRLFEYDSKQKAMGRHEHRRKPSFGSAQRDTRDTHGLGGGNGGINEAKAKMKEKYENDELLMRNKRSVWTVNTFPFADAHFATFPESLIEPCILAGTSHKGVCPDCGKPWERIVEKGGGSTGKSWHDHSDDLGKGMSQSGKAEAEKQGCQYYVKTLGWEPTCDCGKEPIPATVLDPFGGAFTTAVVAMKNLRHYIMIELNPAYVKIGKERLSSTTEPLI